MLQKSREVTFINKKRLWLISFRKKAGLTQQEVSKLCDITQQAYGQYETGQRRPNPENCKKIAKILNFKWTKFYDEK